MKSYGIAVRAVAVLTIVALVGTQTVADPKAKPTEVKVLPLDGTADAATRAKLSASVGKLARVIDGKVTTNATTFADTAAAAGCDPADPACAESVRTLLQADELVYGTANADHGKITVVVRRKRGKSAPTEVTASFAASESPDHLSERVEPRLLPLFSGTAQPEPPAQCPDGKPPGADNTCTRTAPPETCPDNAPKQPDGTCPAATQPATCPDGMTPGADGKCPAKPARPPKSRDFKLGLGAAIGGGAMFLIGLALWNTAAGKQDDIDAAPTNTPEDFQALQALEDQAGTYALSGNLFVVGGLALGGVGAYLLWRDHKNPPVTVAPMPVEGGAGVMIRLGRGGFR